MSRFAACRHCKAMTVRARLKFGARNLVVQAACAALAVCAPAPAFAADSVAPPATATLPSISVTATRSEVATSEQPLSSTVVTSTQILETPAQSLDDVLRTVVGLNLPDYSSWAQHPTANTVSMRGLGGYARALVLRDGVPLNDPFFGYVQWNSRARAWR